MDSTRFILIMAFSIVLMFLYQEWQKDYGMTPEADMITDASRVTESVSLLTDKPDIPEAATQEIRFDPKETIKLQDNLISKSVTVSTDIYRLHIDLRGAGIVKVELNNYPISIDRPDRPLVLMDRTEDLYFISQGGLLSNENAPTHESIFRSTSSDYFLTTDQDILEVPFTWSSDNGITVYKIYEFQRNSYQINVRYEISNNGPQTWNGWSYVQLKRNNPGRAGMFGTYSYTGAVLSSPEDRYEKISFDDISDQELQQDIVDGWVAMIQHYFVSALIPVNKTVPHHYYTKALDDGNFAIGMRTPRVSVNPGETTIIRETMYIGPKIQKDLEKITDGLEYTVDFGILWFIAKPLFWCLGKLYELTLNWGWSIILVTIALKLIFYPLSAAGYRSMANMKRVQPRILTIRERYKEDKTRLNQAMMQIYKEEKINPFGGCLPILVQIPVFIALYWVLLESVEMRQASFMFWLNDLSSPDPFYVLPLLMGITMFIQQKLNPAPMDPVQAKVMSVLPIVFTIFFAFFQSGLVLYWVVNNSLSIIQQWNITRNIERSGLKPKSS